MRCRERSDGPHQFALKANQKQQTKNKQQHTTEETKERQIATFKLDMQ